LKGLITILLFLTILTNNLLGQKLIEYAIPQVDWQTWDMMNSNDNAKTEFISSLHIQKTGNPDSDVPLYPKDARILDIDGDGMRDMIYIGEGSFSVYLRKGDSLKLIKSANEKIVELIRSWPDAPVNIKTADFDCCNDEGWEFKYYHFTIEDRTFQYKLYRSEIVHIGTKDLFHNMPPTQIRVAASTADLVFGPNSEEVIRTYPTGNTGYAIASFKSDDGKLWWKVFIKEPEYKLRVGWIEKGKLVPVYQTR
jgi:hypothetical protein